MIDLAASNNAPSTPASPDRQVFRMLQNSRMAGSIPAWTDPNRDTATLAITQSFEAALNTADTASAAPANLLGYQPPSPDTTKPEETFGFGDLLDIVNPLQHIPIVNSLYREITGDTIRPAGRVVGGALFGGPFGAAGSLVNVVIEEETGKDITGNAIAFIAEGKSPSYKSEIAKSVPADKPEENIADALAMKENKAYNDLPAALLSFADPGIAVAKPATRHYLHENSARYNA